MKDFIKYYFYVTGIFFFVIMTLYLYHVIKYGFITASVNSFLPTIIILAIIAVAIANIYIAFHFDKLIKHKSQLLVIVPVVYFIFSAFCYYTSRSIWTFIFTVIHLYVVYTLVNFLTKKSKKIS